MKINGKDVDFDKTMTISEILDVYKIDRKRVVVEVNMQIIDEEEYDTYIPDKEAMVELIAFVGGG
ncbi:sulfur carrier protein ThiS [Peptacetobacter hominis]|uniref:Sulfur carrier protein ThiS n=1 Tax=Peptacetobacter hominis TaxID=2743610 RepID=A0A544QX74_9FIRM|nr:sulfur carrier protein ThiS [Peptacetobacter hominis]TQQ85303.1 sulfur carrier protein ThiS [Peptacetobacter hominis]